MFFHFRMGCLEIVHNLNGTILKIHISYSACKGYNNNMSIQRNNWFGIFKIFLL